ncbi:MAG: hypothetical protein Q9180_001637 [Flavoplaca navasiana]
MATPESKSLNDLATITAASLRQIADQRVREVQNIPTITLPGDGAEVDALVVRWFELPQDDVLLAHLSTKTNGSIPIQNADNLQTVMMATNRQAVDLQRNFQCEPIVYGKVPTLCRTKMIKAAKFIALVALDDLDRKNGLPIWKCSPATVARGQTVFFDSDQIHIWLPSIFGGLALLLLFEYASPGTYEDPVSVWHNLVVL